MPPRNADAQPSEQERDFIVDWIDHTSTKYDPANPDPGRVTLHRLNRAEYANTIRDLTGVDYNVADDFPPTTQAMASTTSATCSRCRRC